METAAVDWADFSVSRLGELCRLRECCDCYADRLTKRALQAAIFSVYLDCRRAGLSDRARQILVEWLPETLEAQVAAGAPPP
jgi:hypothetical protein